VIFIISGDKNTLASHLNKEFQMPYVNIKVTRDGVTPAQKAALIAGATELLVRVLAKDPASTFVLVDEVDADNWGWKGQQVSTLRAAETAAKAAEKAA
jgi:4-oxalocrotonate tautomerase